MFNQCGIHGNCGAMLVLGTTRTTGTSPPGYAPTISAPHAPRRASEDSLNTAVLARKNSTQPFPRSLAIGNQKVPYTRRTPETPIFLAPQPEKS